MPIPLGHPGLRLCPEGAGATPAEALREAQDASSQPHPGTGCLGSPWTELVGHHCVLTLVSQLHNCDSTLKLREEM